MNDVVSLRDHCPFCKKPIATEENENQYDWLTKDGEWEESEEYWNKYCWRINNICNTYGALISNAYNKPKG